MKDIAIGFLVLQSFWILSCSTTKQTENPSNHDLKELVGKKVTLVGKTVNRHLGAVLALENGQIVWMDEMFSWPDGYYTEKESKIAQVTGVLTERYDLPVFIQDENDSIVLHGIPVPKGTNLKEASHRYLIKDFDWKEIKQ